MDRTETNRGAVERRSFLADGGAVAAGSLVSACDLLATDPDADGRGRDVRANDKAKEALSLADRVKSGDLPVLAKRLPKEPLVLEPIESSGWYSATWNTCITAGDAAAVYENIGYEHLVRWNPLDRSEILPNLATSWEMSDDALRYTFKLIEGAKWSDGHPFTADDIVFAYDDVLSSEDLYPVFPTWLQIAGEPGTVVKADDYTVEFRFAKPHAFLLERLAMPSANILTALPRHYLQQFHPKYNPAVDALAEDEGFGHWADMFFAKGGEGLLGLGAWQNLDLPTLLPWQVTEPLGESDRLVGERNPYYWKTDPDGRQLPYFDRVVIKVVDSEEVAVLQSTEGQYSLPSVDIMFPNNKPTLASSRESGNYHFIKVANTNMNAAVVTLNQTHKDPQLREVFQNRDFRIGLSHAINRQEIIDAAYQRQGEPWQSAPRPESPYYDEEFAKQFTEYDVSKAEEYLDRAGYSERDDDGYRLRPDGKRISIIAEVPIGFDPSWVPVGELVAEYWKEVGIQLEIKSETTSLFFERTGSNEHDATVYGGEYGIDLAIVEPKWYLPLYGASLFGLEWATWYISGGRSGQQPPSGPLRQLELYDQIKTTPDRDEQTELFMECLQIAKEEFYIIGTALPIDGYNIVKNDFHNVPDELPYAWLYSVPGIGRPEQFFSGDA